MTEETKKAPVMRFQGFSDDWEQRKFFDNIQNTIDFRGRTPKKLGMDWSESGYLALSALNVKNGYIDPSADAHYGDGELYKKWMGGRELRKGQVLFTTEAPMGNVAQVPDNQGYILSQRTITFDVNDEKITDDFLAVLLRSPNVFNDLSALASGGTAKGVSQKSLSGLKVIVPRNLCEQEKIGLFFKQLDSAIALHQRKLTLLKQLKQTYLQALFPQSELNIPTLRFARFSDSWEHRKVSSLAKETFGGGTPKTGVKKYWKGSFPWIQSSDLTTNQLHNVQPTKFITEEAIKQSATHNVPGNSIAIVTRVGVGKLALMRSSYSTSQDFLSLSNLNVDAVFGVYCLYKMLQREVNNIQGTSIKGITKADLLGKCVSVPTKVEEQVKIGAFFKKIDDTIDFHESKLKHILELKKAFLEKMFL